MEQNSHQRGEDETPDSPLSFSVPTSLQDYIRRSVCGRRKYHGIIYTAVLLLCFFLLANRHGYVAGC